MLQVRFGPDLDAGALPHFNLQSLHAGNLHPSPSQIPAHVLHSHHVPKTVPKTWTLPSSLRTQPSGRTEKSNPTKRARLLMP
jgi:hypothetical protein